MAADRTIVRRYATALYEAAEAKGQVAPVTESLARIASAAKADPRFAIFLTHPRLSAEERAGLIVAAAGGTVVPVLRSFAELVAERRRTGIVPYLHEAFALLAEERSGRMQVGVSTFEPLTNESVASLQRRLEELLKSEVTLTIQTDRELLGGVQLRIGDRVVDGSLRAKLVELRQTLIEGGN